TSSWWGSALYLNMDPSPGFGVTLRGEYFNDANQLKVYSAHAKGGNVFATTLSANIKADNLIFIPEFRIDRASRSIFTNKDGRPTQSTGSFLLAAIYQF
ncbi:MAG TPA: outer membrane beta-barrel protein, partial [Flavisolibacter sp.]|nr:outer membrane beta-barrel protein [Flavisolibacter sp.]